MQDFIFKTVSFRFLQLAGLLFFEFQDFFCNSSLSTCEGRIFLLAYAVLAENPGIHG